MLDPHRQGVHGPDERELFGKLAPCSDAEAAHLCRLVLMKALPALADCDIAAFGSAIKELQARLGDYFAPIQGGSRFQSRRGSRPRSARARARSASARAPGVRPASPSCPRRRRRTGCWHARRPPFPRPGHPYLHRAQPRSGNHGSCGSGRARATTMENNPRVGRYAMTDKNILHMLTPLKHMSPFDANMALDVLRCGAHLRECDARGERPRPGRNVLASAEDRGADRTVRRRQERDPGPRHAVRRQEGADAAVRHLPVCRPGGFVHHRGGDGGLRGEDVARQEATQPEGSRSRSSARPAWSGFPPASSPQWKAPTSRSWATTASSA